MDKNAFKYYYDWIQLPLQPITYYHLIENNLCIKNYHLQIKELIYKI